MADKPPRAAPDSSSTFNPASASLIAPATHRLGDIAGTGDESSGHRIERAVLQGQDQGWPGPEAEIDRQDVQAGGLRGEFRCNGDRLVLYRAQNRWARRRRIRLAELLNEPWALPPPESDLGAIAMGAFRAAGLDLPRATVFSFATDVRMNFLASGRFLTVCATSVLRFPRKRPEVKVLPVDMNMASVPIGIVTLKHRTISPVARRFIEQAREIGKQLSSGR